ncbi:MAG: pyridoxamine 5'-phosphate oxidase family protein [Pseudomonadota bacterium]
MSEIYTAAHRKFQQEFGTEALADGIESVAVNVGLNEDQKQFIESRQMFFLSSLDEKGRPTVSYKGGAPGFVKVLNENQIMFPSYDGNGMFYSIGNIDANREVGLLFIDFEKPNRLRMQGQGAVLRSGPEFDAYPGADLVVRVEVTQVWVNCPRYVHRMTLDQTSPYVPDASGDAPIALWKRIEGMSALLSQQDQVLVDAAGTISAERYAQMVAQGELR